MLLYNLHNCLKIEVKIKLNFQSTLLKSKYHLVIAIRLYYKNKNIGLLKFKSLHENY